MATQPLETIPEETPAPTTTPARVTADPPKTKPATEKNPWLLANDWPNVTSWPVKPRKRQWQRPHNPRRAPTQPQQVLLSLGTQTQKHPAAAQS